MPICGRRLRSCIQYLGICGIRCVTTRACAADRRVSILDSNTQQQPHSSEQSRQQFTAAGEAQAWDKLLCFLVAWSVEQLQPDMTQQVESCHTICAVHYLLQVGALDELSKFPAGLVADMMGMGAWRMNGERPYMTKPSPCCSQTLARRSQ